MEALKHIIPLVFAASLFMLVLKVGFETRIPDLLYVFRRPGRLIKAVLAVNVIVPVFAILILMLIPINKIAAAGVLLMAISPVPPLVPGKQMKVGGDKAYSYSVYVALALAAVVIVPLWVLVMDEIYPVSVALPAAAVARNVALTVLLPLVIGLAVHRAAPSLAARAGPILGKLAMLMLVLAVVPMLISAWPAFVQLIGDGTVLVMALVVLVALLAGHLLGGPEHADRAALAVTAATRHPGIAMMIAAANTSDPRVVAAILGFMIVGIFAALPYQIWIKKRAVAAGPV